MTDRDWAELASLLAKAKHSLPNGTKEDVAEELDQKLRDLNCRETFADLAALLTPDEPKSKKK